MGNFIRLLEIYRYLTIFIEIKRCFWTFADILEELKISLEDFENFSIFLEISLRFDDIYRKKTMFLYVGRFFKSVIDNCGIIWKYCWKTFSGSLKISIIFSIFGDIFEKLALVSNFWQCLRGMEDQLMF